MLSDSSTPGQRLSKSDTVTTHSRGRGGRLRDAAVLRDDVAVAICQDRQDCWLHVYCFSQPWRHNAYRLPQASAIAICSAEKSRGPGHFTLTLDSPSAVLEGCVDDSLQLSQLQGRPLLKKQSLPSGSEMDIPFQIQQFECLCIFAHPDNGVRGRGREYFLAVCDMARRELIIFSLDLRHKLGSIDISSCPQLQTILSLLSSRTISEHQVLESVPSITEPSPSSSVQSQTGDKPERDQSIVRLPRRKNHDHGLMSSSGKIVEGIRKENKECSNVQLQERARGKQKLCTRIRNGKNSRVLALVPHKTHKTETEACCTEQQHGKAEKVWEKVSKQEDTQNHGVNQIFRIFEWTSLHRGILQRAKCVCRKALKVLIMNTLLSHSRQTEVRADGTPLKQDAMPRHMIARKVLDLSRQLIDYFAIKASEATSECLEEVRKSLTYDPNTLNQNVSRGVVEILTTFKKIYFIATATSRYAGQSECPLASKKHLDALLSEKNLQRSLQLIRTIMNKAEESLRRITMNKPSQSTGKPQRPPSCQRSNVDTKVKQQNLLNDNPINKEPNDELSRRRRAKNEQSESTELSQPPSTCQPACNGSEQKSQNPILFLNPMHRTLYEAELARRQRRGEDIPKQRGI